MKLGDSDGTRLHTCNFQAEYKSFLQDAEQATHNRLPFQMQSSFQAGDQLNAEFQCQSLSAQVLMQV